MPNLPSWGGQPGRLGMHIIPQISNIDKKFFTSIHKQPWSPFRFDKLYSRM